MKTMTTKTLANLENAAAATVRAVTEANAALAHRQQAWRTSPADAEATATRVRNEFGIMPGAKGCVAARAAVKAQYEAARRAFCAPEAHASDKATASHKLATAKLAKARKSCAPARLAAAWHVPNAIIRVESFVVRVRSTPGASTFLSLNKTKYSKAWHRAHGPATDHETQIDVRPDWADCVQAHGLAVCNGLFTLDAEPARAPAGYAAFAATWVEQGRGYDIRAVKGVIVRAEGRDARTAHVDGVGAGAVKRGVALLRKRARAEWVAMSAKNADLVDYRDVHVALADSRAAGNCDAGARQWCARAGIVPEDGATIGQVLGAIAAGAGGDSMALAACRVAVARQIRQAA